MPGRAAALDKLQALLARAANPGTEEEGKTSSVLAVKLILRYGFKVVDPELPGVPNVKMPSMPDPPKANWWEPKPAEDPLEEAAFWEDLLATESFVRFPGEVSVVDERPKAIKVISDIGTHHWIPKSQVYVTSEVRKLGDFGRLVVTRWFAGKSGWLNKRKDPGFF